MTENNGSAVIHHRCGARVFRFRLRAYAVDFERHPDGQGGTGARQPKRMVRGRLIVTPNYQTAKWEFEAYIEGKGAAEGSFSLLTPLTAKLLSRIARDAYGVKYGVEALGEPEEEFAPAQRGRS